MAFSQIKNRIRKAQRNAHAGEYMEIVAAAISRGAFYDDMTDEEKNAYCSYRGFAREVMEEVEEMVTGSLHFQVERTTKPMTKGEIIARAEEIQEYMKGNEEDT